MVLSKRRYKLRKRSQRVRQFQSQSQGCTNGTIGKKRIPELRQCRHKIGRNQKPTKKPPTCPKPRRKTTGLARMTKQQLECVYEIERKKRALACQEQAVARMERAIARRERAMRLAEKTNEPQTTARSKKCPGRKAAARTRSPEVVIIDHYTRDNPRCVTATIDLTSATETGDADVEAPRSRAKTGRVSLRIMNALGKRAMEQRPPLIKAKPPSDTMFSGQGSNVHWQSSIFSMDSDGQWPPSRPHRRPMPSNEQGVKKEAVQSAAAY